MHCGGHISALAKCSICVYWGMYVCMHPSMFAVAQWATVISPGTPISAAVAEQRKCIGNIVAQQNWNTMNCPTWWHTVQGCPKHICMHSITHLHITMSIHSTKLFTKCVYIYTHTHIRICLCMCMNICDYSWHEYTQANMRIFIRLCTHTQTYAYSRQPRRTRIQAHKTDRLLHPIPSICLQHTAHVHACATWLPVCVCAYASYMDRLHQALELLSLCTILPAYAEVCVCEYTYIYIYIYIYIYTLGGYGCSANCSVALYVGKMLVQLRSGHVSTWQENTSPGKGLMLTMACQCLKDAYYIYDGISDLQSRMQWCSNCICMYIYIYIYI